MKNLRWLIAIIFGVSLFFMCEVKVAYAAGETVIVPNADERTITTTTNQSVLIAKISS